MRDLNSNGISHSLRNGIRRKSKPLLTVDNACLYYGSKVILDKLNINVEQGSIYALLGASGCGKTSILSCVVGIRSLTSGQILFGGENVEFIKRDRGGLRNLIGYMPQELALYKEFSIRNALFYFGRIFGMESSEILKRVEFLVAFLNLPPSNTVIQQLSGGEQRRASFAVALLHSPKLLILDEPTVGVDPLLRKRIWEHLINLATVENITIIITTHYMEEASSASTIGVMRKGRILAEGSPSNLLQFHQCSSLDNLFLKLSAEDTVATLERPTSKIPEKVKYRRTLKQLLPIPGVCNRLAALTTKNFIYIYRQLMFVFILLFFPAIQLTLCCWALGGQPFGLALGTINHELAAFNYTDCNDSPHTKTNDSCGNIMLSCRYIQALSKSPTLDIKSFPTSEDALAQAQQGLLWGFMEFPKNFSAMTFGRALAGLYADNFTVVNSRVRVQLDLSNHYIAASIQYVLFETFQDVMRETIEECEPSYVPEVVDPAIWFDDAIYGRHKPSLTEYMGPGLILIIMFFTALSITGINYIVEKREGMLERTIVAGVSTTEVITAQLLTHYATIIVQTCICLAVLIGVFKVEINGPIGGVVLLIILQGSLGMFAGFLLSSVCNEEKVVMQWTAAITIPCLILAGIVWPLAAMPTILKYVAYIFIPQTFACESLRSMITRGWGMTHPDVWPGFVVTFGWLIVLWTTALIFARRGVLR